MKQCELCEREVEELFFGEAVIGPNNEDEMPVDGHVCAACFLPNFYAVGIDTEEDEQDVLDEWIRKHLTEEQALIESKILWKKLDYLKDEPFDEACEEMEQVIRDSEAMLGDKTEDEIKKDAYWSVHVDLIDPFAESLSALHRIYPSLKQYNYELESLREQKKELEEKIQKLEEEEKKNKTL